MSIYDPKKFKKYCERLGGKVTKLEVDEENYVKEATCEFEAKELKIHTDPEWLISRIIADGKKCDLGVYCTMALDVEIKKLKDLESVEIWGNGEVKSKKPVKWILDNSCSIKKVD
ncbi:MAG TPA: hypothetical protein ENG13_04920 [bacterium]|nr:hypothetical protein [bacterium]HEX68388.1 hypothetical protein [bacterium]